MRTKTFDLTQKHYKYSEKQYRCVNPKCCVRGIVVIVESDFKASRECKSCQKKMVEIEVKK